MASTELEKVEGEVVTDMALPAGFRAWEKKGHALAERGRKLSWEIADWVIDGEDRFEDLAVQVFSDVGLEARTVAKYVRVARAFPPDERPYALPFRAYDAVAALEPGEAHGILADAVQDGLTSDEIREVVRQRNDVQQSIPGVRRMSVKDAAMLVWTTSELFTQKDGEQFYLVPIPVMNDLANALKVTNG